MSIRKYIASHHNPKLHSCLELKKEVPIMGYSPKPQKWGVGIGSLQSREWRSVVLVYAPEGCPSYYKCPIFPGLSLSLDQQFLTRTSFFSLPDIHGYLAMSRDTLGCCHWKMLLAFNECRSKILLNFDSRCQYCPGMRKHWKWLGDRFFSFLIRGSTEVQNVVTDQLPYSILETSLEHFWGFFEL